jgi:hypothetical protein
MSDEASDDTTIPADGSWGIKWMPGYERMCALKAAKRSGLSVGQWLAQAIRTQIEKEREVQPGFDVVSTGVRVIDRAPPPNIEDFGRAIDIAERLVALRGERLSNAVTERLVTRLAELVGIEPAPRPFHRRRPDQAKPSEGNP